MKSVKVFSISAGLLSIWIASILSRSQYTGSNEQPSKPARITRIEFIAELIDGLNARAAPNNESTKVMFGTPVEEGGTLFLPLRSGWYASTKEAKYVNEQEINYQWKRLGGKVVTLIGGDPTQTKVVTQ